MIYGNKFLPTEYKTSSDSFTLESMSVAYNEYTNRLSLLESCTNEEEIRLLEAQVQVLYEVGIKDIMSKVKSAWEKFKEWIRGLWTKIKNRFSKLNEYIKSVFNKNYKLKKNMCDMIKNNSDQEVEDLVNSTVDVLHKKSVFYYKCDGFTDKVWPGELESSSLKKRMMDIGYTADDPKNFKGDEDPSESAENATEFLKGYENVYNTCSKFQLTTATQEPDNTYNICTVFKTRMITNTMSLNQVIESIGNIIKNANAMFDKDETVINKIENSFKYPIEDLDAYFNRYQKQQAIGGNSTIKEEQIKHFLNTFLKAKEYLHKSLRIAQLDAAVVVSLRCKYTQDINNLLANLKSKSNEINSKYPFEKFDFSQFYENPSDHKSDGLNRNRVKYNIPNYTNMKQKQNKYGMDKYNDIDKEISDGYNKIKNAQKDIEGYQARTQQKLDKMNKLSKEI